ncbi:hypothetical protein B0H63DRAFT_476747 [Podospora didyma]|uniref:Cdc24/Scd1 N-terminal domain-containing protein n=1 Tax=Podospora didyma TaxID=330526 RepID=A0AAE0TWB1_9PEZI|nr:hypothetical protein B0H63DRAFT_476747 [Podospora didyma]
MEALGAVASVAGIFSAVSAVVKILGPYATATKDAPKIAAQLLSEALATKTIVGALHLLTTNLTGTAKHASLIQVDQIIAVLTYGVHLFSEFESLLQTLPPPDHRSSRTRLFSSVQWIRKKATLTAYFTRIQAFKLSVNCILSILQSDSQSRAEDHQQQLITNVDELFRNNQALTRLILGADAADAASIAWSQRRASVQTVRLQQEDGTTDTPEDQTSGSSSKSQNRYSRFSLPFETHLNDSRVYRRAVRNTMDYSMRSSVLNPYAWSVFTGLSLSNISDISVLCLPIYPEDITNPQHYSFGSVTSIPAVADLPESVPGPLMQGLSNAAHTGSIFQECIKARMRLSQLDLGVTDCFDAASQGTDHLSSIIFAFRLGKPLMMLLDYLSYPSVRVEWWDRMAAALPTNTAIQLAVPQFTQTCIDDHGVDPADCFTTTDLMSTDRTKHVKIIRLVNRLLDKLSAQGTIRTMPFESHQASVNDPAPAIAVVDKFLRDERDYVDKLEYLHWKVDHILELGELPQHEYIEAELVLRQAHKLAGWQRRFLFEAEIMFNKPHHSQTWHSVFHRWSQASSTYYATFITGENLLKSAVLQAASKATNSGRRINHLVYLKKLALPAKRIHGYREFLEELSHHCGSKDIELALDSLQELIDTVEAQKLADAEKNLHKGFTLNDNSLIRGLGRILMFEDTKVVENKGATANGITTVKVKLYLFEKAMLQVEELESKAVTSLSNHTNLSIRCLIQVDRIRKITKDSLQGLEGFKVTWEPWATKERFCLFVPLQTPEPRLDIWINRLNSLRPMFRTKMQEYRLVVAGGDQADKSMLTQQLIFPQTPLMSEVYDPTLDSTHRKHFIVDCAPALLDVIDTGNQYDNYYAVNLNRERLFREGDGFLLVYSVTSRASFDEIASLRREILRMKEKDDYPMVIVGGRCSMQSQREVTWVEGKKLADSLSCKFIEVDAKENVNVEKAFFALVREVRRYAGRELF